ARAEDNCVLFELKDPVQKAIPASLQLCSEVEKKAWIRSWNGAVGTAVEAVNCDLPPAHGGEVDEADACYFSPVPSPPVLEDHTPSADLNPPRFWEWDGKGAINPWFNAVPISVADAADALGGVDIPIPKAKTDAEAGAAVSNISPNSGRTCKIINFDDLPETASTDTPISINGILFHHIKVQSIQTLQSLDNHLAATGIIPSAVTNGYHTAVKSSPNGIIPATPAHAVVLTSATPGQAFDLNGLVVTKVTGDQPVSLFVTSTNPGTELERGRGKTARVDDIATSGETVAVYVRDAESVAIFCKPKGTDTLPETCAFDDFYVCV
ncbi:hypothetical protein HK104_006498, partial [Borealophlyctis nickersoniae]